MTTYRPDIDGLRAISIGLVVAYHAGVETFAGGYVGVDVFFVVSGFLITGLLIAEVERTGTVSLRQFIARRARRLLPLAGVVLTVTALAGAALMAPLQRPRLFDDIRAAALFVANWRFAGQATDYSDVTAADSLVNHWWSLAVEEQFYVVWPLAVMGVAWLAARSARVSFRAALTVAVGLVVAVSLTLSVMLTARVGPEAYYLTHVRLWELGVGAFLAAVLTRHGGEVRRLSRPVREVLAAGGLLAVVWSALRYDSGTPFPGWAALLPVGGAAALIVAGSGSTTVMGGALGAGAFTRIGNWSYAWYLWHWPVIGLGLIAAERWDWNLTTDLVIAGAVALSLVLAAASHHVIENPLRRSTWLVAWPHRSMAAGVMAVVLPVALITVFTATLNRGDDKISFAAGAVAMTPEQGAADVVALPRSNDCNATIVQSDPGTDCVFGDLQGTLDVVLLGDSHAQHWLPAFDRLGWERAWRIHAYTKSACPAVELPVWNTRLQRRYTECATWHEQVQQRIADLPGAVIVMVNTHGYASLLLDKDGKRISDVNEVAQRWSYAASTHASRLLDTATMVVRLHDTPWSPEDVPTCLSLNANRPQKCAFHLDGRSALDKVLLEAEIVGVNAVGVGVRYQVVNPTHLVCPDDPCQVVTSDGTIVFRDQHHLGQTFSTSLAGDLGELLREHIEALGF